jgi:predicted nucleic-acid-binding protein
MLAIDANLIVRYLTGDDPEQSRRARGLIDSEAVYVCTTALMETEWVLRSVYGYDAARLAKALRAFLGLPSVTVEEAKLAGQALDWMEGGMDFADALHLSKADGCEAFVSFDKRFARAANRRTAVKVRAP